VDFARRTLDAAVTLHFHAPGDGPLDLDTRGLEVTAVTDDRPARPLPFALDAADPVLGARLR
jgi:leukotriene-A4 hydrolase